METGALGRVYSDGEIIIRQGDKGDCMYVVQSGQVEVVKEINGQCLPLAILCKGEIFGEMAIFENEAHAATVRAVGSARILTIDQMNFMRRIHEDPSVAYHLLQIMSGRVRELGEQLTCLRISIPDQSRSIKPELNTHETFMDFCKKIMFSVTRPVTWTSKFLPM